MEQYYALAFATWLADNGWYRNGSQEYWYQIPKQNENKTITELYEIFRITKAYKQVTLERVSNVIAMQLVKSKTLPNEKASYQIDVRAAVAELEKNFHINPKEK